MRGECVGSAVAFPWQKSGKGTTLVVPPKAPNDVGFSP
jgi:hypothetical protein